MIKIIKKLYVFFMLHYSAKTQMKYYKSKGCKIGDGTRFTGVMNLGSEPYLVEIGKNCLITGGTFHTHDGGVKVLNFLNYFEGKRMDKMQRIRVGDNVFIGNDVRIMGGVSIGNNCIIGAGSIVTKDIPDNSVVAGIPARIICTIDDYYERNKQRGCFFPTAGLNPEEKRKYLENNITELPQ